MSLEIRPDHLKIVEEILEKHVPDREVWAFGSRVNGTAKETSDLDLVVIGENPLDFQTLGALRDDFSESNLPYKVDVVDWAKIGETFREIIRKDKIIIKRRQSSVFPSSWYMVRFGDILIGSARNGVYKPKEFHGSGVKIVNMGELFANPRLRTSTPMKRLNISLEELQKAQLEKGDLLFARRSLVAEGAGKCSLVIEASEPAIFESSIIRARPALTKVDSTFLYYLFSSPLGVYLLGTIRRQVAVSGITGSDLMGLTIPLPPLPEQRAIAHILGTLDDKIELNRRMNETLEAMAQAIFKSWFVDFDPVRAKAEGRDTGLSKEIADLFPDGFEESELGEIPKCWKVSTVGDNFELNPTERIQKGEFTSYIDMASIPTAGSYPNTPIRRPFSSGSKFRNGDTVLARITPCLENGKTAFIQLLSDQEVAWGSTEFIIIRPKEPYPKEFGYLLARDNAFREHAIQSMTGTSGRQRVQEASIARFKIIEPDSKILKIFGMLVQKWFLAIKLNSEQILVLTQIRELLLPKLLKGEIQIDNPESPN